MERLPTPGDFEDSKQTEASESRERTPLDEWVRERATHNNFDCWENDDNSIEDIEAILSVAFESQSNKLKDHFQEKKAVEG